MGKHILFVSKSLFLFICYNFYIHIFISLTFTYAYSPFLFLFLWVCILVQTAYIDVCDDTSYAFRAKSLQSKAAAANVPAITTGGIYPGVSNGAYFWALSDVLNMWEILLFHQFTVGYRGTSNWNFAHVGDYFSHQLMVNFQ